MRVKRSRAQYLIFFYIIGYIISLLNFTGEIPGIYYYIPVRISALNIALIAGNGIYYTIEEKYEPLMATIRSLKYALLMPILYLLSVGAQIYLYNAYNIDIEWLIL
ncbi:MAG: hypothetical protein N4A47_04190 [Clostridia bacterium]|nr:hypothetical protein [Clostridia bacterium]